MFDIIIIGAGPGGYETAAEAAALGQNVAIVERDQLGGTCLNRGCIPTKALCRNAEVVSLLRESEAWGITTGEQRFDYAPVFARKEAVVEQLRSGVETLMSAPGITLIRGEASLSDAHTVTVAGENFEARHIIIATGSAPRPLPIEGAELALTSDDILALSELPQSLCIVGGGVIGMEFAVAFSTFGVDVTVVEFCKEILPPFDRDIAKRLRSTLSRRGIKFVTGAAVSGIVACDGGFSVSYTQKDKVQSLVCQQVLMAVGRQPVLPEGLDAVGVRTSRRGIEVDGKMQTNVPGIYAIGDVNGLMMLAHAASAQGRVALHAILGMPDDTRLDVIPAAVFTVPELAMVGLTEEQCTERGLDVSTSKAFFRSNGKAVAMGETDGLLKMIVDNATRRIVGCHVCGPHAADLIQEVVTAMNADATIDLLAHSIHGHPTLSEVVQAAARQC